MSHTVSKILRPLVLAASLLSIGAFAAQAQTKSEEAAKPAAKSIFTASAWNSQCTNNPSVKTPICQVQKVVKVTDTGQFALSVAVLSQGASTEEGKAPKLGMQIALPHGLFLPDGIIFRIDEEEAQRKAIKTCYQNGCFSSFAADEKMIAALKKGTQIVVGFNNFQTRSQVTIPVSLKGFSAALAKVKLDK